MHSSPNSRPRRRVMAALVLGFLIASANGSYNTQASELEEISTNVVLLDRTLALYGPEAHSARIALKQAVTAAHEGLWGLERRPGLSNRRAKGTPYRRPKGTPLVAACAGSP